MAIDFVAGLTTRGIIAPWMLDGPFNRDAFETYVEKVLIPKLRPGDIVISGAPSAASSTASPKPKAKTTSMRPDTLQSDRRLL
jgi:hypothetical protein